MSIIIPMPLSSPDAARDDVARLVKKFKALSAPERRGMNEAQTRQGYILPLFAALGWRGSE